MTMSENPTRDPAEALKACWTMTAYWYPELDNLHQRLQSRSVRLNEDDIYALSAALALILAQLRVNGANSKGPAE